jgi:hypothetical protein
MTQKTQYAQLEQLKEIYLPNANGAMMIGKFLQDMTHDELVAVVMMQNKQQLAMSTKINALTKHIEELKNHDT